MSGRQISTSCCRPRYDKEQPETHAPTALCPSSSVRKSHLEGHNWQLVARSRKRRKLRALLHEEGKKNPQPADSSLRLGGFGTPAEYRRVPKQLHAILGRVIKYLGHHSADDA